MNLRTPMATKVLGALALLVIAGAGWMFVVGPATSQLADVREQTQAARDQNDLLTLQLLKLKQQAAALDETRADAKALAAKFPPTADQPGLFEQVNDAATGAGIGQKNVTALTPTPPVVGGADAAGAVQATPQAGGLAQQTLTVSVEGDFAATQHLLRNLEELPRAYLVSAVTMSGGADTGAFTTSVTGTMFVMPPAPDPKDAGPRPPPAQTRRLHEHGPSVARAALPIPGQRPIQERAWWWISQRLRSRDASGGAPDSRCVSGLPGCCSCCWWCRWSRWWWPACTTTPRTA